MIWRILEPLGWMHRMAGVLVSAAICCGTASAQDPTEKPAKGEAAQKERKKDEAAKKDADKQRKKDPNKKAADQQAQQKKELNKKEQSKKELNKKEQNKKELGKHERVEKPLAAPSPEREAAALAFVREHHAELADLVAALKTHHPQEYQRAIRDLVRVSENLKQLAERDRNKYDLDLQAWKLRSRVELLAVRLKMNAADESLRGELKQLLGEQLVVQQAQLKLDRERAQARLEQIDKKLERLKLNADDYIDKQLKVLLNEKKPAKHIPSPSGSE